jgi:predicted MFS family arabinose efflux permease
MPVTRRQIAVALLLLASLNAFGFIDRVVVALVTQQLKAEFSLTDLHIGLLGGTAFAVVNALAAIPVAWLAERFKRSHVTAAFLLAGSLFTMLAGMTTSVFQLLACRLGMATGSAATEAPPHSMISDMVPPERRASAISIFMLGVPVAALLGSFAGGAIAQSFGWRQTFLVFGLLGGAISLLCFAFLKEPERKSVSREGAPRPGTLHVIGIMLRSRAIIFIILGACFVSFASFGVNTFLPALLQRVFGLGAAKAGLVFGLISGIASMVGTLAGGYVSEHLAKRDPRWLLGFPALGSFIGAPLFIIGVNSGSIGVAIPLMLVGSFAFYTAMGPCIATLHGSLDSYTRATGSALFLMVMHLVGQGVGPPLVGQLSDVFATMLYSTGQFAVDCAGAAAQVPGSPCAAASGSGLRYAVTASASFHFIAGTLLYLGARTANPNKRKYYG